MKTIRILMVDDEKLFCGLVKMNLELTGKFEVHIANNGKDGAKAAKKLLPDIILLDIIMPKQNGFEALDELKQDKNTVHIPVIMMSALTDDRTVMQASKMYCEHYITKPVTTEKLIENIELVLGINRG